jgi:hypothetical protein
MINKAILLILTGIFLIISSCCTAKWVQLEKEKSLNCLNKFLTDTTYNAFNDELLVPDEETAIKIAEIFLFKNYSKREIVKEKPYKIGLVNNYWIIIGSLPSYYKKGGTFEMVINSKDGKVIGITHSK